MLELGYPCPEDVARMDKTSCGHYCTTCSKEIMDFRNKTNEETMQILKDNPSINCGIFHPNQMKHQTVDQVSSWFRIAFAAVFIFGFNMNILFAQTCESSEPENIKIEHVQSERVRIGGRVYDINGEELVGATIYYDFNETRYQTTTDSNGLFEIEVAKGLKGKNVSIAIMYPGMKTEMVYINPVQQEGYFITVKLEEDDYIRGKIAPTPGIIVRDF